MINKLIILYYHFRCIKENVSFGFIVKLKFKTYYYKCNYSKLFINTNEECLCNINT